MPIFLEKLQLLYGFRALYLVMTAKYLHHAELLVCHAHNTYMPLGRKYLFNPFNMHIGVFPAAAMSQVNAELEHLEAIGNNLLPEPGVYFPVLFGFRGKVEKN